jgi:hypothetical protein
MDISNEIQKVIGQPESSTLEYKAVLPPSKNIAQLIAAFANSEGGYIVLGVSGNASGKIEINGLSEDFHANTITHKALDLLTPIPVVSYQYVSHEGKKLYAIKIAKSDIPIAIEDKIYRRVGGSIKLLNPVNVNFSSNGYARIKALNLQLETYKSTSTNSQYKLIEHYQSILKISDDLSGILYPERPELPTEIQEGKILSRILFTSIVDNFETYLSDLLYEIFLANPTTLKSSQPVTIEEVLNCTDLQEFVKYWAKQKIGKLQKGSVKGFIKENKQISQLEVLDDSSQNEIEKILQIRHLYSHRNGVVDEKFLQFFAGQYVLNSEHQMAISEVCDKLQYLAEMVTRIDKAASSKFKLALVNQL